MRDVFPSFPSLCDLKWEWFPPAKEELPSYYQADITHLFPTVVADVKFTIRKYPVNYNIAMSFYGVRLIGDMYDMDDRDSELIRVVLLWRKIGHHAMENSYQDVLRELRTWIESGKAREMYMKHKVTIEGGAPW